MRIEYSSNNSGGGWWLKDEDWKNLEAAGWIVEWGKKWFHLDDGRFSGLSSLFGRRPDYVSDECDNRSEGGGCCGHRLFRSYEEAIAGGEEARWLGGLAREAFVDRDSAEEAIREFERITGQDASDEGCNCCGAPHAFKFEGRYIDGEEIAELLTGVSGLTYRRALERLGK